MPPKTFAHYENLSLLGRGSFGEVYRATDTKLGREVALKFPHPFLFNEPGFISQFQKEAEAAAR